MKAQANLNDPHYRSRAQTIAACIVHVPLYFAMLAKGEALSPFPQPKQSHT
jgi:hypothetical protein